MVAEVAAMDVARASRLPSLPQEQRCCSAQAGRFCCLWERRKPRSPRLPS